MFFKLKQQQNQQRAVQNEIVKIICKVKFHEILMKFSHNTSLLIEHTTSQCDGKKPNGDAQRTGLDEQQLLAELNDLFSIILFYWYNYKKNSIKHFKLKTTPAFKFFQHDKLNAADETYLIDEFHRQSYKSNIYRVFTNTFLLKNVILLWSHPLIQTTRLDLYENMENFLLTFLNSNLTLGFLFNNLNLIKFLLKPMDKILNLESKYFLYE
jgi:hypothetical protein